MSYILEAEHEDGFVISDPDFVVVNRHNSDDSQRESHGPLTRFSAIGNGQTYSIDFTKLPPNARPIHYTQGEFTVDVATGERSDTTRTHFFGYQYTEGGKNVKEIKELP